MKKILAIITLNIILILLTLFISDIFIYKQNIANFYDTHAKNYTPNKFSYVLKDDFVYLTKIKGHFNGTDNIYSGRLPVGVEYKNREPITILGGSFAHGQYLEANQNLGYKLSRSLKRPVFNRGVCGQGFAQMYYQVTQKDFYNEVPPSKDVIYIMIDDHYRRSLVDFFGILDLHFTLNYSVKNNTLIQKNYDNPIINLTKSLYTYKYFNQQYVKNFIRNPKNADKLTDMALLYFIETRKNLEKNWKNKVNFTVFLYDCWAIPYKELLKKKLLKNNFLVIDSEDYISQKELTSEKYIMQENFHPTEKAWNYLTPIIAEKITQ